MPPKANSKDQTKKVAVTMKMQSISDNSLYMVPSFAAEGWLERLHRCVDWTLIGSAIRFHQEQCHRENLQEVSFSEGYQNKLKNSILGKFLDTNSNLTLQDHWDFTLSTGLWDKSLLNTEEARNCFVNCNNLIDDYISLVKRAVWHNDRSILERGLKDAPLLRLNNCKITHLDEGLLNHRYLANLILCKNFISQLNCENLPRGLRALEMQANRVSNLDSFICLPPDMLYLGLSKNLLVNEGLSSVARLPRLLTCLDLSDNDIYELEPLLNHLARLPFLKGLHLAGNPCAMSAGYAVTTVSRLQRLKYLDNRQVLATDRITDGFDLQLQPEDLRANYFFFNILRIISPPIPPKVEKGIVTSFHVEFELPLLDSMRRSFLMTRRFESLIEYFPPPEDEEVEGESNTPGDTIGTNSKINEVETESEDTDIFAKLKPVDPYMIRNFTIFESPRIQWAKVMVFPDPTLKIFCPDLTALRDTFRSTITLRFVYSMVLVSAKKADKKGPAPPVVKHLQPDESRVTIATIKCSLQNVDWSQPQQYFHWDDSLGTDQAIHWGDGDLRLVNYQMAVPQPKKVAKGAPTMEDVKLQLPENLTCHFSFGIYSIQPPQ